MYILGKENYTPTIKAANTGSDALKIVEDGPKPFVIVLDLMCPYDLTDEDGALPPEEGEMARGVRIARELVEKGVDSGQIVVLTALPDRISPLSHNLLKEMGIVPILVKPTRTSEILKAVRAIYMRVKASR